MAGALCLAALGACGRKEPPAPPAKPAPRIEMELTPPPDDPNMSPGERLLYQDRLAEASEEFRAALRRNEKDVGALVGLSKVAVRLGDGPGALVYARRAAELQPEDGTVTNYLGTALQLNGRPEDAARAFERALGQRPDDPLILMNAALSYADLGRWERAHECAGRAAQLVPGLVNPHVLRGQFCVRQGKPADAAAHFREALRIVPDRAILHYHLGKALLAAGKKDEGAEELRAALRGDAPPEVRKEIEGLLGPP
jgi:Flp pilus assembly protein TadD